MTIPDHHPRVAHFDPYWFNDSLLGIAQAERRGYRYIDQDCNLSKGDPDAYEFELRPQATIKHWGNRKKDGFTHIWTGKHYSNGGEQRKEFNGPEHLSQIEWDILTMLRRGEGGGTAYLRFDEHLQACVDHHQKMCCEVKGDERFEHPQVAADMYAASLAVGQIPYIMTLSNIGPTRLSPPRRLKAFKDAGFETALLPRGARPSDWDAHWAPYVDAVWGHWT